MKYCLIIGFYFTLTFSFAQKYSINDKKAIDLFEKALAYYNIGQLDNAKVVANKALERNSRFVEAYLLLADIFNEQRKLSEEIAMLKKVIDIEPDYNEKIYLMLAKALYKSENFDKALEYIETFLEKGQVHNEIVEAKKLKKKIEFAIYAYKNPVPFNPVRLSINVNSPYKDYWPSLTIDEQELYYTVALPTKHRSLSGNIIHQEDLFVSKKDVNGVWQASKRISGEINTDDNEGSQSISANGQFLFYVACNRKSDFGSCDIYISERTEAGWSKPKNIGRPVNSEYWESTPSSSADGRILLFSSNRSNSKGGKDLYISFKKSDGTWSEPKNMGDSINTEKNEYAPFLHPDGKTLYFSSDGWLSLGGQDIFVSRMKSDSTWTSPKNLGYPINTSSDDFGLIVNASGRYAFFASNREGSQEWDLYTFELYEEVRPDTVIYITGKVYDIKTGLPLVAEVELYELENKNLIYQAKSYEESGKYLACIPKKSLYAMNVNAKGYLFYSEHFSLEKLKKIEKSFILDIPLKPIEIGTTIILKNIFYETDKFDLKPESEIELNKLVEFLKQNPKISIEISGHTDNVGSSEYNKNLSTNRAKTVYQYLISKGIAANRLKFAGYGFSKPIANNDTPEGRALNRRTEFKIISVN